MRYISISLSALALCVSLYVLWLIQRPKSEVPTPANPQVATLPNRYVFINTDSVLANYTYFKNTRQKLEDKGKKMQKEFETRAASFQTEVEHYKKSLSTITIGQAKSLEEELAKKQQNLQIYQQNLEQDMANEQMKMTNELFTKLTRFLKKYAEEMNIEAVFKLDANSDLLYGGPAMDITQEVIAGLNVEEKAK